ncbi:phage tail protein [Citrobacter freundii]|uniref:phage tail-collar fiber domain-containing protein n=1 Tax=Citrobacter freundii TaxID=546 RepID=UPI0015EAE0A7|nr:phage tail protein [Citrobacter freundii]ELQ7798715.1 phage tail protein [Citrobacter freundii]QLY71552.1 phage tail protein [Citrobacter freundii]
MATKYYALLTNVGAAKLANATALGEQVEITQMAVGDGNGALPTPNPAQTALVHELRRAPLNTLTIDPVNTNQIIAEQVIPEDVGGWWIREIGLYDSKGDLIAIANCAETYKPLLQEGSGRMQVIRVILIVSSTQAVTLKIDPSVVLATRQYVDDQIIQVKAFVDQQLAAHIAAADPHKQYAPKASPALTGTPTAPTAAQTVNNTQIATTEFVKSAIAALVASSPAALDTLNELAAALGDDPNFATTVTNALAGKQPLDSTLTDLSGKTVNGILQYLGLGAGAPAVGIPFFWPHTQMPNNLVDDWNQMTFLKMNGSSFTAAAYPVLAKIWPGLVLPDFRGEFIRIWDDGRGIDSGRNLLTAQSFAMQNITGSFGEIADESKQYAVEINAAYGAFQAQTYMRNIMRNPDFAVRDAAVSITFDASRVAQTAAETRPRNISIGFIVRAK